MGTLNEDLSAIKNIEEGLTANKVSNFAYTDYAYEHNDVNGVDAYNINNEQNIPLGTPEVMKVNATVVTKGWRAQASAITRMLMNHFLGRISYNLNKVNDNMVSLLTTFMSHLGTANGIASLDSTGRMPYAQLPQGAMTLEGDWDADTNTPELSDSAEGNVKGQYYNVSVAGTQNLGSGLVTYLVGDSVIFDGSIWKKISGGSVRTVNGASPDSEGEVTITGSDIRVSNEDTTLLSKFHLRDIFSHLLGRYWKLTDISTTSLIQIDSLLHANGIWLASFTEGNVYGGVLRSTNGKNWTKISDNNLRGGRLSYGNGTWVLTKSAAIFYTSTDNGSTWTASAQQAISFNRIQFFNNLWLASTSGGIYYSTDLETWNVSSLSSGSVTDIYYLNGYYIASPSGAGIYYSTNGMTWTQNTYVTSGTYYDFVFTNKYTGGVGTPCYVCRTSTGIDFSNTGIDGKFNQVTGITDSQFNKLYSANGLIVVGGIDGMYCTSAPGVTSDYWETCNVIRHEPSTGVNCFNIKYANGVWVANSGSSIIYSLDGVNWMESEITEVARGNLTPKLIDFADGAWVFASTSSTSYQSVYYSDIDILIENGTLKLSD